MPTGVERTDFSGQSGSSGMLTLAVLVLLGLVMAVFFLYRPKDNRK
jgi:hypothetical protein